MDDFFNTDVADWIFKSAARMDPDEAEMFSLFLVDEVYWTDRENNARTINRHVEDIHKSLYRDTTDEQVRELIEVVSKAKLDKDIPYDAKWGKPQPRDKGGKFVKVSAPGFRYTKIESGGTPHVGYFPRNTQEPSFDLTQALSRTGEELTAFEQRWNSESGNSNKRTYERIRAGAKVGAAIAAGKHPGLQAASQAADFVGQYGPEAEKVIGPAARRTAYRYRGTEREPDQQVYDYEDLALEAELRRSDITTKDVTPELRMVAAQNAAIAYLSNRLPSKQLAELHRQSGKLPPSEGMIISPDGHVVTQAMGYNEDHYLPFNLKSLKGLKGGSYVRTRSSGGLTSEDIYTGLIAGARSVTVVSRSGVFTLDFEDDLRGGRRYSDKARQMVGRYAQTLDAVQSEQVARRRLDPDERAEIREEVEAETAGMGYRTADVEQMIRDRENEYTSSPRLTASELEKINQDAQSAADTWRPGRTSSVTGRTDRVREPMEKVPADPKKRFNYYKSELMDAAMEEKSARMYRLDAEGYKAAMDALREQFPYFVKDVDYRPFSKERPPSREKDTGYVRPRYIRPKAVQAGYFDTEINGKGKVPASTLHYQNYRHTKQEENADQASESAEGAAAKKPNAPLSDVELNAQRAKSQAIPLRRAALKQVADQLAPHVGDYAKNHQMLERYRKNDDLTNWTEADIDQLHVDVEAFNKLLATDDEYRPLARSLEPLLKNIQNYSDMLSESGAVPRSEWNPRVVPATPHKFSTDAWHEPGQPAEVYANALGHAIRRLGDEITPDTPDEQLRGLEAKYGNLYAAARDINKAKPEDRLNLIPALTGAMIQAGEDNQRIRGVAGATPEALKTLEQNFEKKWLAVKEVRSIKHNAKSATPSAPKQEAIPGELAEGAKELPPGEKKRGPISDPIGSLRTVASQHPDVDTRKAAQLLAHTIDNEGTSEDIWDAIDELPPELNWLADALMKHFKLGPYRDDK